MSIKVGITGGIGTGKSFVSSIFRTIGVPFYDADKAAKQLMVTNSQIKEGLCKAFGSQVYFADGNLDRKWLAAQVFLDKEKLALLNSIVHPVVIQEGENWANSQTAHYCLKEAALLIESNSYKALDYLILVQAPETMRIERVMQRDSISRAEVEARMNKQMPEEEKIKYADFIIVNDERSSLVDQIAAIHKQLMKI